MLDLGYEIERRGFYSALSLSAWDTHTRRVFAPLALGLGETKVDMFRGGLMLSGVHNQVGDFAGLVEAGLFENSAEHFTGLGRLHSRDAR